MIKVSVWYRRGAFLEAPAVYCDGCVGLLPGANQGAGVDYWRPVRQVLGLCLACACRRLGLVLAWSWLNPSDPLVKLVF